MAKEQKRKLENNWKNSENQENEIVDLEKKTIIYNPTNIIKKNSEIVLADRSLLPQFVSNLLSYTFDDLPEWAIPYFRLKYFFTSEDGYDMENVTFSSYVRSFWVQNGVDSSNYTFNLNITADITFDSNEIPLYITASLIFNNPRSFNELQFNKA